MSVRGWWEDEVLITGDCGKARSGPALNESKYPTGDPMEDFEKICDRNGTCLAIIIRTSFTVEKTVFFSASEYSQQVGIIKYPQGGEIKPHYHNELLRHVVNTQEVLVIRKGSVKVELYDSESIWVTDLLLQKGDTIFLISGGHGFKVLDDCEMLEVKQGPYNGRDNDKTQFAGRRS
jgi:hypothetical protein